MRLTPKTQARASLTTLLVGMALLALMVATEGEPGALPLGLVLMGAIGFAGARWRARHPTRTPVG